MISEKDVQYIADLSRINVKKDEIKKFTKNLENILHYVHKLIQLNVEDVKPTFHVLPMTNVFRKDAIKPSLKQEKALENAPQQHKGSFKVPPVIE